jgi:ketosteroid isomerase-like protein
VTSDESTTPDLVELARQFGEAVGRRDFDAVMRSLAPGAVWDASQAGVGTFEGPAAIRAFLEDWLIAYEQSENRWEEIEDLGDGVVFTVNRQDGRPAGSKGRVQERYALTFRFGGAGLILRVDVAQDIDEARAAAERLAESRG